MKMNGVLGNDYALSGYYGETTTWANEMDIVMNHAPGAGLIARCVHKQSSELPLYVPRSPLLYNDANGICY